MVPLSVYVYSPSKHECQFYDYLHRKFLLLLLFILILLVLSKNAEILNVTILCWNILILFKKGS